MTTTAQEHPGTPAPRHPGTPAPRHPGTPTNSTTDVKGNYVPTTPDRDAPREVTSDHRSPGRRRSLAVTVLVAAVAALIAVTMTVLIMAPRGREAVKVNPSSEPNTSTTAEPSSSPSLSTSQVTADGCLGGAIELNRAIISAQEQAPLTSEGAAAFAASLIRWTSAGPAPVYKVDTATQILAADASPVARDRVAIETPTSQTSAADFTAGRFYVESYTPTRAVVSFVGQFKGTQDGSPLSPVIVAGAVTLVAQNGTWHFQDLTDSARDVPDLLAVSSPYTGGC